MPLRFGPRRILISNALSQGIGIPQFITINGQRGQLLLRIDGTYLTGSDGSPLYGKVS